MPHFLLDKSYCRHQHTQAMPQDLESWNRLEPRHKSKWHIPTAPRRRHRLKGFCVKPSFEKVWRTPFRCSFKIQPSPFSVIQPGNFHFERPIFKKPRFSGEPPNGYKMLPITCLQTSLKLESHHRASVRMAGFFRGYPVTIRRNAYLFQSVPDFRSPGTHALLRVLHPPTIHESRVGDTQK